MHPRFAQFPRELAERSRTLRLGDVPVLIAHPDPAWRTPAPVMLWMHGRTAHKELDPGRYLRWIRAGVAACAIDLPGHGERAREGWDQPARTLEVLAQALGEVDAVLEHLADPALGLGPALDLDRVGLGGMSLGGMVALRRLCEPHTFACAAVESTTGWLSGLYFPQATGVGGAERVPRWEVTHDPATVQQLEADAHLRLWRPIPLLALHSAQDAVVPLAVQERFVARLREHYRALGVDPGLVRLHTWPSTGAPMEHSGFGKVAHEAKTIQTEFLASWLRATPPVARG